MLEKTNLVGPAGYVKERIAAFKEAGVTHLSVNAVGADPVTTIEQLKSLRCRSGRTVALRPVRSDHCAQTMPRSHQRLSAQASPSTTNAARAHCHVSSVTTSTGSPIVSPSDAAIWS